MATPDINRGGLNEDRNLSSGRGEQHSSIPDDLPDSPQDQEKLQPEETVINLPDVSDIPGQENITVPYMESFADTTIASADEEGDDIFSAANEVIDDKGVRAGDAGTRERHIHDEKGTRSATSNKGNSAEKARTSMGQDEQENRGNAPENTGDDNVVEGTP